MLKIGFACVLAVTMLWTSCRNQKTAVSECACDEFPFPKACDTKCETGQAVIESVNTQQKTAMVSIRRGTTVEQKTVPLSALPPGLMQEKGSQFTTLFKKQAAAPENPTIVRFAKEAVRANTK